MQTQAESTKHHSINSNQSKLDLSLDTDVAARRAARELANKTGLKKQQNKAFDFVGIAG